MYDSWGSINMERFERRKLEGVKKVPAAGAEWFVSWARRKILKESLYFSIHIHCLARDVPTHWSPTHHCTSERVDRQERLRSTFCYKMMRVASGGGSNGTLLYTTSPSALNPVTTRRHAMDLDTHPNQSPTHTSAGERPLPPLPHSSANKRPRNESPEPMPGASSSLVSTRRPTSSNVRARALEANRQLLASNNALLFLHQTKANQFEHINIALTESQRQQNELRQQLAWVEKQGSDALSQLQRDSRGLRTQLHITQDSTKFLMEQQQDRRADRAEQRAAEAESRLQEETRAMEATMKQQAEEHKKQLAEKQAEYERMLIALQQKLDGMSDRNVPATTTSPTPTRRAQPAASPAVAAPTQRAPPTASKRAATPQAEGSAAERNASQAPVQGPSEQWRGIRQVRSTRASTTTVLHVTPAATSAGRAKSPTTTDSPAPDEQEQTSGTLPFIPPRRKRASGKQAELEARAKEKMTVSKSARNVILNIVRDLSKTVFNISKTEEFINHVPAPAAIVDSFHLREDGAVGPDPEDIHMDVAHEAKSPWNIEIHDVLVEKTKKVMADDWEGLPAVSDDYIRQIVEQRCQSLWSSWRKVQRQHGETDVAAATRWGEDQDRVKKASRQRKRRTTKWETRLSMATSIAETKEATKAADAPAWVWMRDMLESLGHEGMSSDESDLDDDDDDDTLAATFRVKTMPWRRNITRELDIIDAERRRDASVYHKQGSKPVHRRRDANLITSRPAAVNLPRAFYSDAWFGELSERELRQLRVNERSFEWANITAESSRTRDAWAQMASTLLNLRCVGDNSERQEPATTGGR
ncbi:hypothetical protein PHLGIDRAFT_17403, partial [Phlebiopsis gigantea 11061_1 CR5-6]